MKYHKSPPMKPSIDEAPKVELKDLPPNLRYGFLGKGDTLPVIIGSDLNLHQVEHLVEVLKMFKKLFGRLLRILLGSLPRFVHIQYKSCPIINQVLSTRDV